MLTRNSLGRSRQSLQFRVTCTLTLFVVLGMSAALLAIFVINEQLQDDILNSVVAHEMGELKSEYSEGGADAIPHSPYLVGFVVPPNAVETLPSPLRDLPPQQPGSDRTFNHRTYRVGTAIVDGQRAYMAYNITDLVEREQWFRIALVVIALAGLALAVPVGMWIARISLKPIHQLAARVGELNPGDRVAPLAARFDSYEVGLIARAFDRFMNRLDEFVERERRFTADASHELRTPVAVIQGAVELMLLAPRPEDRARLNRIEDASRQMSELIEALMFLARDEPAEATSLSRADKIIVDVIDAYRDLLADHRVATPRLERCEVAAPRVALVILFGNLLRNAIRHGGEEVRVTLLDGVLTISDNGDGMDDERLAQAFERGVRSGANAGLGLGLYLVKRVADRYGWQIQLDSSPGKGTLIQVRLVNELSSAQTEPTNRERQRH